MSFLGCLCLFSAVSVSFLGSFWCDVSRNGLLLSALSVSLCFALSVSFFCVIRVFLFHFLWVPIEPLYGLAFAGIYCF